VPKRSVLDRLVGAISPALGLKRARARASLAALDQAKMHYEAASRSRRTAGWRIVSTDATGSARGQLGRLRDVSRDVLRNNPYAVRGQSIITGAVVGAGIIPHVEAVRDSRKAKVNELVTRHFDTTDIDADGCDNLYGLQALILKAVVSDGEVLVRRRFRRSSDGLALPFQVQVLEADYLDTSKDGVLANGNRAVQGIEFDLRGRRVAYWLYTEHPAGTASFGLPVSKRVPARDVLHIFRRDRPGQVRGVPWLAPVIMTLQDLADFEDAQLMRQKIAACFAAFIIDPDGAGNEPAPTGSGGADDPSAGIDLAPGIVKYLSGGRRIEFTDPPDVGGYVDHTQAGIRKIAIGLGITYESLSGDLSRVNYSSARMGRLDMDRNVDAWQWLMVIPQFCDGLARWTKDAVELVTVSSEPFSLGWTPPRRALIDPTREIPAMRDEVRAGFSSRRQKIRQLGFDPEVVEAEIKAERDDAAEAGLVFESEASLANILD
jgi:lambda family phage portal protein